MFGDPLTQGSEVPKLSISIDIGIESKQKRTLSHDDSHNVIPDFVEGWAFGDAVGVGLRCPAGEDQCTVTSVKIQDTGLAKVCPFSHWQMCNLILNLILMT